MVHGAANGRPERPAASFAISFLRQDDQMSVPLAHHTLKKIQIKKQFASKRPSQQQVVQSTALTPAIPQPLSNLHGG